jgi:hypothetical protein
MKLKSKKIEVIQITYSEFNKFVKKIYNVKDYSVAYEHAWSNDSSYKFDIKKRTLQESELQKLKNFKDDFTCSVATILTDLCNRDYIEPGTYLIDVCW